ncbi:hypothetical protein [Streptomyces sp. NBC_00120]|uniref:hypothetical protein n=1 Tax=Streptomyces sp. NBC_00120 TaxID=2975660 RepID=UPI002251B56F|nr:hypothetical protein [Streptomyces sp. NBC_00120]MCX5326356.1 hypothetical protein [Streptomyces sp. NBC_00120]
MNGTDRVVRTAVTAVAVVVLLLGVALVVDAVDDSGEGDSGGGPCSWFALAAVQAPATSRPVVPAKPAPPARTAAPSRPLAKPTPRATGRTPATAPVKKHKPHGADVELCD